MLSLEPHLDVTLLTSTFLFRICTCREKTSSIHDIRSRTPAVSISTCSYTSIITKLGRAFWSFWIKSLNGTGPLGTQHFQQVQQIINQINVKIPYFISHLSALDCAMMLVLHVRVSSRTSSFWQVNAFVSTMKQILDSCFVVFHFCLVWKCDLCRREEKEKNLHSISKAATQIAPDWGASLAATLLTLPPPGTCLILSLEPQRDVTWLKSSFLWRIWT